MTHAEERDGSGSAPVAVAVVVVLLGAAAIVHLTRSGPTPAPPPGTQAEADDAPPPPEPRTRVLIRVALERCDAPGTDGPETRVSMAGEVLGTTAGPDSATGVWDRLRDTVARRAEELRAAGPADGRFEVEALLETSVARQVPPRHRLAARTALADAGVAVARTTARVAGKRDGDGTFTVRDVVLHLRSGNDGVRVTLNGEQVGWGGLVEGLTARCREETVRSGITPGVELRAASDVPTGLLRQAMAMVLDAGVTEVTVGGDPVADGE